MNNNLLEIARSHLAMKYMVAGRDRRRSQPFYISIRGFDLKVLGQYRIKNEEIEDIRGELKELYKTEPTDQAIMSNAEQDIGRRFIDIQKEFDRVGYTVVIHSPLGQIAEKHKRQYKYFDDLPSVIRSVKPYLT